MVRPTTVIAVATAIAGLAVIALLMGVFAGMRAAAGTSGHSARCGHVLDGAYRHGHGPPGCASTLRQRRIEVTVAAGVAGAAAIVGVAAFSRVQATRPWG